MKAILTASLTRYRDAFVDGQRALGTEQYSDAFEGLAAMQDPTSGAARFRDWRSSSRIEYDVSYLDDFARADAFYDADNEPVEMGDWSFDMDDARVAISDWVDIAVKWQISESSDEDLAAAAAKVNSAFAKVQRDIASITATV